MKLKESVLKDSPLLNSIPLIIKPELIIKEEELLKIYLNILKKTPGKISQIKHN
jgi:hypothetical protein